MKCLTFVNANLILEDQLLNGVLGIVGNQIEYIGETLPSRPGEIIDCDGDFIAPGLIELHTDNLERHIRPRPATSWPYEAAILAHDAELASCGITTVFDAMRVGSIPGGKTEYQPYARSLANHLLALNEAGELRLSHKLHLRAELCSETLVEELSAFGQDDSVRIISLMDHMPGERQFRDIKQYKAFIQAAHHYTEVELDRHIAGLHAVHKRHHEKNREAAISSACELGAVLASHDDTTLSHVEQSLENGVSFAEFPTSLEAALACQKSGIMVMMGAPNLVRGESHSNNVAAEKLAGANCLDLLSSDYIPLSLFHSVIKLGEIWEDLPRAFHMATSHPARVAKLSDRGRLLSGLRADLLRFSLAGKYPRIKAVYVSGERVC